MNTFTLALFAAALVSGAPVTLKGNHFANSTNKKVGQAPSQGKPALINGEPPICGQKGGMCIRSNELSGKAQNIAKPISRVPSKAISTEKVPIKGAAKPINNAKNPPAGKGTSKGGDEKTVSKTPSKAVGNTKPISATKPISSSKPNEGSKNIGNKKPNVKQGVVGDKLVESSPSIGAGFPSDDDIIVDTEMPNSDPIIIDGMPVVDLPGTGRVGGAKRGGMSKKVIKVASGAASSLKNMIFAKHFRLDHKA